MSFCKARRESFRPTDRPPTHLQKLQLQPHLRVVRRSRLPQPVTLLEDVYEIHVFVARLGAVTGGAGGVRLVRVVSYAEDDGIGQAVEGLFVSEFVGEGGEDLEGVAGGVQGGRG